MKKWFGIFLGIGFLCAAAAVSISADKPEAGASKEKPAVSDAKQQVMNDLSIMQNQEVRLIVLQQLLGREAAELRQSQAVFCDAYKLDVEKWRKGIYRYDDKEAKFVEVPETPPAK